MATTTVQQLVSRSLRKLGVLSSGRTATDQEVSDGKIELQDMLEELRLEKLLKPIETLSVIDLVAGQAAYQIGDGLDIDMTTPSEHVSSIVLVQTSGQRLPVPSLSLEDYSRMKAPHVSGTPRGYNYRKEASAGIIAFTSAPDHYDQMEIVCEAPIFAIPANNTETFDIPKAWRGFIVNTLAIRLAPEYDVKASEEVVAFAQRAKKRIKQSNVKPSRISTDSFKGLAGRGRGRGRFNIHSI